MNKNTSPVARLVWTVVSYSLFGLVFLAVLYPLFWMLITSLKDQAQIYSNPYGLPNPPTLDNYVETWTRGNFGTYFWNSLLITVPSLAGVLIVSSLAGYAFARFRFAGSRALFLYLLIGVMVPPQAIMISAFLVTARLDLIDTRWALLATYLSWSSIGVFILTTFFRTIPQEIEDSARLDGASPLQVFWHIAIPLAQPALATVAIFYFVWIWNDFLYPLLYLQSEGLNTIPLGLMLFRGRFSIDYGMIASALSIGVALPLVCYMLFQDKFVRGLTSGALKG